MTRKIVAALAAIAALSSPLVHAAQPRFSLTSLAPGFIPYAFNTDAVAVGMMWNGVGGVVDHGTLSFLAGLGGNWTLGQGINTAGIVVGSAQDRAVSSLKCNTEPAGKVSTCRRRDTNNCSRKTG